MSDIKYSIENWPFRGFGYWKEYGGSFHNFPSINDFINPEINNSYKKEKLLFYLRNCYTFAITSRISFPMIFSSEKNIEWLAAKTDGDWWWLENISEMIEYNNLIIPRAFYRNIENKNFIVPKISDSDFELLKNNLDKPIFNN